MARNSVANSTIFKSKQELLGYVTNELPRKMVKIENPIAKLCHYFGIFSQVLLIILVYLLRWYYLLSNFSPCNMYI